MTRERDLFRAIVVSAVALVGPACSDGDPAPVDSGASRIDASTGDDAGPIADAGGGRDAAAPSSDGGEPDDAGEDAGMVLIL